jgi:hypothetical protein
MKQATLGSIPATIILDRLEKAIAVIDVAVERSEAQPAINSQVVIARDLLHELHGDIDLEAEAIEGTPIAV